MRGLATAQAIIDAKRLNSDLCQSACLRSDPLETEAGLWPMREQVLPERCTFLGLRYMN